MKLVGDNLRKLRKQFKLTQQELSDRVNVSRETISRIENNRTNPTTEIVYLICDKLGVSVSRLMSDSRETG